METRKHEFEQILLALYIELYIMDPMTHKIHYMLLVIFINIM